MPSTIDPVSPSRTLVAQSIASDMANPSSAATAPNQLGKQDFLQLLIAQLRNQDPLKPMEDREFIAQLAQFSSLEALQGLSAKIDGMAKTGELERAAALVGKKIRASLTDGSSVEGIVSQMQVEGGVAKLLVDDRQVGLDSVTAVLS